MIGTAVVQFPLSLAALTVGPVQFDQAHWLILIPVLGAATAWMGRRSLAGLGPVTRWVALAVRLVVIAAIAGALSEPQWRTVSKDVAVTVVLDVSQSIPGSSQGSMERYVEEAVQSAKQKPDDRLGIVTAGKEAFVQSLPSRLTTAVERQHVGAIDGTNLAAALRLAMAVMPQDAANRIVLITDGNETVGSLRQAAEAARAAKVPIDFLPLRYKYEGEVLVDRLIAPATARSGENLSLKVVIQATKPTRGRLTILMNGQPVDLDPDSPALGAPIELQQGLNVVTQTIASTREGPQEFEAVFEPEIAGGRPVGDAVAENNRAQAVTFVTGESRVLLVAESTEDSQHMAAVLREANINAEIRNSEQFPTSLTELSSYDAVIMVNEGAYAFSQQKQEDLKAYVHDAGCGLIMVGGPNSFGAGGWIGSPLEDALPIKMDPPQKRQMPRGALALVIHSVEIPEGVYHGKKVCEAAANALSREDYIGIVEYGWGNGGTDWVYKPTKVGDGSAVKRAIQNLNFGDMPDFAPSLELSYRDLMKLDAGQRHVIMISDGDPQSPSPALLKKYRDARITISTVGVATHNAGDVKRMESIARSTGGKHYEVAQAQLANLPQIFVKEAQTVKRSLIWEGPPFAPVVTGGAVETMRAIGKVPAITGYVVAADREGLSLVTIRGKENDPILAQWQYGLGKSVAFTSDASTRWGGAWVSWDGFKAFWEQHVRWAMRPAGSRNVRITTETKGDQTLIVVDALDKQGERLNFANFQGRLSDPSRKGQDVELKQVGPGRYEAVVPTEKAGSYVASFIYTAPAEQEGEVTRGSAQAAIVRPFADEYRTLEDNEPLLKQVAELTGGRVLSGDPKRDDLWARQGLQMPVATRPIWLFFVLAGIGLFVMDVGVRRVRIDPALIAGFFRRALSPGKRKAGEHVDSLRTAREQARKKIAERGSGNEAPARDVKSVKFEAPAKAKASGSILTEASRPVESAPAAPSAPGTEKPKSAEQSGDMSRLLKAKKRAQDEMKD